MDNLGSWILTLLSTEKFVCRLVSACSNCSKTHLIYGAVMVWIV